MRIYRVLVTPNQPRQKKQEGVPFELKSYSQAHKYTSGGTTQMKGLGKSQVRFFYAAGTRACRAGPQLPTGPEVPATVATAAQAPAPKPMGAAPGVTYLITPDASEQKARTPVVCTVFAVALTS